MLKEIKNNLYCITSYTGNSRFVECDNEEELISYVAETEWKKSCLRDTVINLLNLGKDYYSFVPQNMKTNKDRRILWV